MTSILKLLTALFPLWIVLGAIWAWLVPTHFNWFAPCISPALGVIMLGMGITLSFRDFTNVLKVPKTIGIGLAAQFTIMPLLGTGERVSARARSRCRPDPGELLPWRHCFECDRLPGAGERSAFGADDDEFDVSGDSPHTRADPRSSQPAHGCPGGQDVAEHRPGRPITTHRWPDIEPIISKRSEAGQLDRSACVAAKVLKYPEDFRRTMAIEVGMQNSGLGGALAKQHLPPASAAPCAISAVYHCILGSLLAAYWRTRPTQSNDEEA